MIPTAKQNYAVARGQARTELIPVASEHNARNDQKDFKKEFFQRPTN